MIKNILSIYYQFFVDYKKSEYHNANRAALTTNKRIPLKTFVKLFDLL